MIHAEEQFFLGQVHHQRNEVFTPALDLHMVAFRDPVNAQVHLGSARHPHRRFFAQEEIRVLPQNFRGIDRVVVG